MSIYSPNESSTSHTVPCNSSFCELAGQCPGPNSSCPYSAQHIYLNTTSNGTLVEDTLYFITEAAIPKAVEASVVFGCGKVQTGQFLENLAPDGMFGLGLSNLSVPSILASKGIAADSFSMCFGADLYGRISFGDKGSSDQDETPFIVSSQNPYYIINITETVVGKKKSTTAFKAIVDSGVFFSYFADPIYSELTSAFADQITEKQRQPDPKMPFEYCYDFGPNQTGPSYPTAIDFLTENGSLFPVTTPFFLLSDENENPVGFCLAFFKADGANIIGLNFMTGLRVVFDRERSVLGWKQVNCYNGISTAHSATTPAPAPAPISDISDNSDGSSNKTRTAPAPSPSGVSSHLNAMTSIFLMIFMLVVTIL